MTSDVATYSARAGQRLRTVREQRGLSLAQVERASEGRFSAGRVGSWERAERHVSAEELARYAAWLGVPVRLLLPPEDGERDLLLEVTASLAARIAVLDVTDLFPALGARDAARLVGLQLAGRT